MNTIIPSISTDTLQRWLTEGKDVTVLDVRPMHERAEWFIPGSIHLDAYDQLKRKDPAALAGIEPDKRIPVVTVCAAGKTSQLAAALLSKQGYTAYSLTGGMKAWSRSWNTATLTFADYEVLQIRRTGKGCLSYAIASMGDAIIIDASLPVEVYEHILREKCWTLKGVVETHIHADHLSRSRSLADAMQAPLCLPLHSKVDYAFTPLTDQERISVGAATFQVISTPGHTMESISLLLNDEVLFSGDTLFLNGVGRPDLKADEQQAAQKATYLYDSLQTLLSLNDETIVLPAHTDTPVPFNGEAICEKLSDIRHRLPLLQMAKDNFLKTILRNTAPPPQNFLTIVQKNIHGDGLEADAIELEAGANRCSI